MSRTLIDYHAARARGGVGLTIIELLSVGSSAYPFLRAGAPDLVAGYQALMAAVRPHGMRIFQQIGHLRNEIPQADGGPPWSSSDTIGALVGIPAEAMTLAQIDELVEAYRAATRDCIAGGLDGIELHMAHGYLVQQFMSPLHNHRTDAYGGSFENRMRLPLRLLETVRGVLPPHMAIGVRLSSEGLAGGMTPDDVADVARLFERHGLIDYLNLTLGTDYNPHKIIGAMHEPAGYEVDADQPPRCAVSVPVLVTGRFRTLEEADQVIAHGKADLVAMTRAHIADPDIVRKTVAGQADDVRPCIGCNHGCIGGLLTARRIGCTVNVAVGAEATLDEALLVPAGVSRQVLVVGGGSAGMEAARVAALRGHRVILAEAANHLGGAIAIARRAPRRAGIGDIVEWLEREIFRLGVDVRLSTYVQAEDLVGIAPDVLIVATGSPPRMDGAQYLSPGYKAAGMEGSHVVSSHDLLLQHSNRNWGRRAVVYDDVGHYEGVAAAEFLIERGLSVTFVTSRSSFAPGLEPSLSSEPALERLAKGDFELVTYARLSAVGETSVTVDRRFGGPPREVAADTVVVVSHNAPNRELLDSAGGLVARMIPFGDVRSPRYLQSAIREGHLAARGIE